MNYIYITNILAMSIMGFTGVLAMKPKNTDLINVIFLGTLSAIGGGTIRDLLLDRRVFWIIDTNYLIAPICATILIFYFYPRIKKIEHLLEYLDGMGLALFVASATSSVLTSGESRLVAMIMGVITGVFGGVLRDVILNKKPTVMGATFYITPAILGASLYVIITHFLPNSTAVLITFFFIFILRSASIKWHWILPSFFFFEKQRVYDED